MPELKNSRATLDALSQIRPARGKTDIDPSRHPNLFAFSMEARNVSSHPHLWSMAYDRFGDEMEDVMRAVVDSGVPVSVAAKPFAKALPDPWILTGKSSAELGDDFFTLWNLLLSRSLSDAVTLVHFSIPARAVEFAEWLGTRLVYPHYVKGEATRSWLDVLGRSLRYPTRFGAAAWVTDQFSVTEQDLHEFMDSGYRPDQSEEAASLQTQLAMLRNEWTEERAALAKVSFSYPKLAKTDAERYPLSDLYIDEQDWDIGGNGHDRNIYTHGVNTVGMERALEGTEGLSFHAKRERFCYRAEVDTVTGTAMLPASRLMWEASLEVSECAHEWLPVILNTQASEADARLMVEWMGKWQRYRIPSATSSPPMTAARSARSWVSFMLHDDSGMPFVEDSGVSTIVDIIRDGHKPEQVSDVVNRQGFSLDEAVLVLGGMPADYVRALRG